MDQYRHIEAWTIAEDIISSILNKMVLPEDTSSNQGNTLSSDAEVGVQNGNILEGEDLPPLNDTAREQDKAMRLNILQKLLELACAMVSSIWSITCCFICCH